jgi:hypothetical protein
MKNRIEVLMSLLEVVDAEELLIEMVRQLPETVAQDNLAYYCRLNDLHYTAILGKSITKNYLM